MEQFQFYVLIIVPVLFLIIGYFSGIISFIIFLNKEFKKQPITFYLISSNIVNLVTVTYLPVMVWPTIWTISTNSCKVFASLTGLLLRFQSWILVFCSIDRLMTVLMPTKFEFKNKLRFQLGLILTSIIPLFLLSIPYMIFYEEILTTQNQTICVVKDSSPSWVLTYFKYEFSLVRVFIPFTIMTTSSVSIVYKMCSNKIRLQGADHDFKKEYQLAMALVSMDLYFILFRIPSVLYISLSNDANGAIIYNYLFSVFLIIGSVPNVFFFIIFLATNKIYRVLFKANLKTIFDSTLSFFRSLRFFKSNRVGNQIT